MKANVMLETDSESSLVRVTCQECGGFITVIDTYECPVQSLLNLVFVHVSNHTHDQQASLLEPNKAGSSSFCGAAFAQPKTIDLRGKEEWTDWMNWMKGV